MPGPQNPKSGADDNLPDWLRALRGDSSPKPAKPEPAPEPEPDPEPVSDPPPPAAEAPAWLTEDEPIAAEAEVDDTPMADTGADLWQQILAEEGLSMDDLEESRPEEAADMSVEEYMAVTAKDSAKRQAEADKAPPPPAPQPEPEVDDTPMAETGADLWQQILAEEGISLDEVAEERPEEAADMSVKDYMAATAKDSAKRQAEADKMPPKPEPIAAETPQDDGIVVDEDLPDWLQSDATIEASMDDDTLGWLADESTLDAEPVEAADDLVRENFADDGIVVDEELPDWLRSDTSIDVEMGGDMDAPWLSDEATLDDDTSVDDFVEEEVVADDLPDWLQADSSLDAETDDTPTWLSDDETLETETTPEPTAAAADDGIVVDEELPEWLRADSALEVEEESAPSWLSDEGTLETEMEATEPVAAEPADDGIVVDDDLPDWLRADSTIEAEEESAPSWLSDEATLETDVEAAEPVAAELADDGIVDSDDLPDWLRTESAGEVEEETPSWLSDDVTLESETDAEPVVAQTEPEAETPPAAVDELEDDGIVDTDDLPDWLTEGVDEGMPEWLTTETTDLDVVAEAEAVAEAVTAESEVTPEPEPDAPVEATEPPLAEPLSEQVVTRSEKEALLSPKAAVELPPLTDRMKAARTAFSRGSLSQGLEIFREMIARREALDSVIEQLSGNLDKYNTSPAIYETLGDAQMHDGRLHEAYESYQHALERL